MSDRYTSRTEKYCVQQISVHMCSKYRLVAIADRKVSIKIDALCEHFTYQPLCNSKCFTSFNDCPLIFKVQRETQTMEIDWIWKSSTIVKKDENTSFELNWAFIHETAYLFV